MCKCFCLHERVSMQELFQWWVLKHSRPWRFKLALINSYHDILRCKIALFCIEDLRNSQRLRAIRALKRTIFHHNLLAPESIRACLRIVKTHCKAHLSDPDRGYPQLHQCISRLLHLARCERRVVQLYRTSLAKRASRRTRLVQML